ncbi:MAG: hypothetical protein ACTSR8_02225 [Promethearchaeota archaeon]
MSTKITKELKEKLIMSTKITKELKEKIFKLISTSGIDIQNIVDETGIDYDTITKILGDEYLKYNLDFGRRMCCRF